MTITKRFLFVILTLVFTTLVFSQTFSPASWEHSVEKISDTHYRINLTVNLQEGYSIYSQYKIVEDGLAPQTFFDFKNQKGNYKLIGKTTEPDVKIKYDAIFEENVKKFQKQAVFTQIISLLNPDFNLIEIAAEYQTCDDEKCILGDDIFKFNLDGTTVKE